MDTINSNGATSHENDTVLTDTGSTVSTVDSERALLNTAPDPPNHEPGGRIMQGISKVKKTFSKKMKSWDAFNVGGLFFGFYFTHQDIC